MRKKYREEAADKIAREIHSMVSLASLSMYHSVKKLIDPSVSDEDKEVAGDLVDRMMSTAESLFDDLADSQKEGYRKIAKDIINMI